ncbi:MAG TPA: glycosyltransferase family 2 protein, partial [Nitrospinaceae bacterium]|nr:glycosyltransferase family 2 protein [Nitrospinaceae bacterium]
MKNRIIIVVPFYNVSEWIKYNVMSVKKQDYDNYVCVYVDDVSTDDTFEILQKETQGNDKFILTQNKEKKYALRNIWEGILRANPQPEDIIITLDGDDWLSSADVLRYLNDFYNKEDCWLTYGSYIEFPSGNKGKFSKQIPENVIKNRTFRESEWCSSHLRSFKHHLWSKIEEKDLLDSEGKFYKMAWDLSFMFPMLEMSGHKSRYVDETMYVYNLSNPLNDHKVDNAYQVSLERQIRQREKYPDLSLNSAPPELMGKVDARKLLNSNRFDISAKTLYARNKVKKTNSTFAVELYIEHLKVWNNLREIFPPKQGSEMYINSFDSLLYDIEKNGFISSKGKVPVINGSAINGAHRIASCITHDKEVDIYEGAPHEGQGGCDYKYFKNKRDFVKEGLAEVYLDEMALEFCRNKENLFTITLFPSHDYPIENLVSMVKNKYGVIYKKEVELTANGKFNYVHNLYHDESWIGSRETNYPGVSAKTQLCFSKGSKICTMLVEEDNRENLVKFKDHLRSFCGVQNHSVHINDTQEETWRIASSIFNANSIHFLNHRKVNFFPNFESFFGRYQQLLREREDREDFCVDSSAVLSAYGLRDCRDLDFLHLNAISDLYQMIECHNAESHHYRVAKNEIIYNPRNHFYLHGMKFASAQTVRDMKIFRNEEKDGRDVSLMRQI